MRPDQLDQQVALAINEIRQNANDARRRLGIEPVSYRTETAGTAVTTSVCTMCSGRGSGRHTLAGPLVDCPECS